MDTSILSWIIWIPVIGMAAIALIPREKVQTIKMVTAVATGIQFLFKKPTSFARPIAQIKKGRLLIIKKCEKNWCNVNTNKFSGWIDKNNS